MCVNTYTKVYVCSMCVFLWLCHMPKVTPKLRRKSPWATVFSCARKVLLWQKWVSSSQQGNTNQGWREREKKQRSKAVKNNNKVQGRRGWVLKLRKHFILMPSKITVHYRVIRTAIAASFLHLFLCWLNATLGAITAQIVVLLSSSSHRKNWYILTHTHMPCLTLCSLPSLLNCGSKS